MKKKDAEELAKKAGKEKTPKKSTLPKSYFCETCKDKGYIPVLIIFRQNCPQCGALIN